MNTELNFIDPMTLKPCTYDEYISSIRKNSPDKSKEEIEQLMGKPPDHISSTILNPETLDKEAFLNDDKFIYVSLSFTDKYADNDDMKDITQSIKLKAKEIEPKDPERYGSVFARPFEDGCMDLCGIPKKCIDNITEEARAFLTNFSVIQTSRKYYDSYDLVIFFNHKDPEDVPYIRNMWFYTK